MYEFENITTLTKLDFIYSSLQKVRRVVSQRISSRVSALLPEVEGALELIEELRGPYLNALGICKMEEGCDEV